MVLFSMIFFTGAVFAADATMSVPASVNIYEILVLVITSVFVVIGGAAVWIVKKALNYFEAKAGVEIDEGVRQYLQAAVDNGINWAKQKVLEEAKERSEIEFKSEVTAKTVQYLVDMVPDAVDYFGLTNEKLEKLIESKLEAKE